VSIRAKIFLVFTASMVAGFAVLAYWVTGELRFRYSESSEEVMVDSSRLLAEQLAGEWQQPPAQRFAALQAAMARLGQQSFSAPIYSVVKTSADIRVYVTDAAGRLLFDSRAGTHPGDDYSRWHDVALTLHGAYGARTTDETLPDPRGLPATIAVAYVAAPIIVNGDLVGVVSLGKPKTNMQRFIDYARRKFITAVLLAFAAAIVVALLLYLWVSRPMQALVEYAHEVSRGASVPLPAMGDNEIGRVGRAIESMRAALVDKEYVESYVQSLTHEVKSPLTAIRASAELLAGDIPPERRAGFVITIEREVDRLNKLADRLLELASLERADRLAHVEPVALRALVGEVIASSAAVAEARGVRLEQQHAERDTVQGDPLLLRQAIDNLLRNALDFAPRGSLISISTEAVGRGVLLTVQDQGPGIPEFARARIFDRFYSLPRPASGRKSTGLGLNFVREVAQLHGGRVEIDCPVGGGTRARLLVPWRAPAA
jgi:two-component system, OmpR family, sensor histidine kinase CreC